MQLWVPEVGGPVDPDSEAHDLLVSMFGGLSRAERNRLRVRVRTAMMAMARRVATSVDDRPTAIG